LHFKVNAIIEKKFVKSLKSRVQPKQEWTEEDSPYYDDICEILINLICSETSNVNKDVVQKDLDWLKSIKDRIQYKQDVNMQINPSEYINDMGGNGCYLKNVTQ
jgi:hypothetical protein